MPFLRFANAKVIHPHVSRDQWSRVRVASDAAKSSGDMSENLIQRASSLFEKKFNPEKFLLTHATIIASVDTISPPGIKTGSVVEDGFKVNRKFSDFRIKDASDKYINNNLDAWSRGVILKAHQTFVGAHNFVEHVQIEEMSRGRIIDAVARDIGDAIYVDILIATDRKHQDLISAIENGKMATLSMGCTVDGTVCTKCGHWAADETELCPHIKYAKGNVFFDDQGVKHRIAELCGHESIDPHGGVQFIEASWVGSPAFTGAVLRNILEPSEAVAKQAAKVLSAPPPEWSVEKERKAASAPAGVVVKEMGKPRFGKTMVGGECDDAFLAGWSGSGINGQDEGEAPPANPMKEVEDEVYKSVLDRVKDRLQQDLKGQNIDEAMLPSTMAPNDTMVKEARSKFAYRAALHTLVHYASSDVALVNGVADVNNRFGIKIPVQVYRAALKVGRHNKYPRVEVFHAACVDALGRLPTLAEAKTLLRISKLLSRRWASGGTDGRSPRRSEDGT